LSGVNSPDRVTAPDVEPQAKVAATGFPRMSLAAALKIVLSSAVIVIAAGVTSTRAIAPTCTVTEVLPLFALAAAMAHGDSRVRGARELREKETDRIESVTNGLRALGVHVSATYDGFRVRGVPTRPRGGGMSSGGDHRIAMLGAIAGLVSRDGVRLEGDEAVAVSFPGFFDLLGSVAQR